MPEAFADDLDVDSRLQRDRRIGVAQVVEPDHRQPRLPGFTGEDLRQALWVGRDAVLAGEDQVVVGVGPPPGPTDAWRWGGTESPCGLLP